MLLWVHPVHLTKHARFSSDFNLSGNQFFRIILSLWNPGSVLRDIFRKVSLSLVVPTAAQNSDIVPIRIHQQCSVFSVVCMDPTGIVGLNGGFLTSLMMLNFPGAFSAICLFEKRYNSSTEEQTMVKLLISGTEEFEQEFWWISISFSNSDLNLIHCIPDPLETCMMQCNKGSKANNNWAEKWGDATGTSNVERFE